MHMLQTMVKPALHLQYSSTIEESEREEVREMQKLNRKYSSTIEESERLFALLEELDAEGIHRP